jgi:hypothetical protein
MWGVERASRGSPVYSGVPDEYPKAPPEDVPPEHHERARELQIELVVLEARLDGANFENREAYRRAIQERRAELDSLRSSTES